MIITLVGPSGSGKTSISHTLKQKYGFEEIVSYTTRQPRSGEKDHVDYHFITNQKFNLMKSQGLFAEYDEYSGSRQYGSTKMSYLPKKDGENIVAVLTPAGIRQIKANGVKPIVVYVDCPIDTRARRYLRRISFITLDDLHELANRMERDFGMFSGVDKEADIVVKNNDGCSLEEVAEEIMEKAGKVWQE